VGPTQPILQENHVATLSGFALSNVLLALDYDGTLAAIAPSPCAAVMTPGTRRLLASAARLYPCVVIAGRRLDDIARRLAGIPVWHMFGNHGLESWPASARPLAETRAWAQQLTRDLSNHDGVVVEDKGASVTVHYRNARDRASAIEAIHAATSALPGARILGGSEAVNVLPCGAGDKGVALRHAVGLFACQTAIYVGDDPTDEDAFAAGGPCQVLGIRVGAARSSAARYHIESQSDIDRLLEALIAIRTGEPGKQRPVA